MSCESEEGKGREKDKEKETVDEGKKERVFEIDIRCHFSLSSLFQHTCEGSGARRSLLGNQEAAHPQARGRSHPGSPRFIQARATITQIAQR